MILPLVNNIQRFSIHDGHGIRTTIFFKGCLLNCWWCHNPEGQSYSQQLMFDNEKCAGCKSCLSACNKNAISISNGVSSTSNSDCILCGDCLDYCANNAREIVGKSYTVTELIKEVEKDYMFYEQSDGGVTLSGGEIMTQDINYLVNLAKGLKRKRFNIAIDTCGQAPFENYEKILPYVDTFLYDIKLMNSILHEKFMGVGNELILSNLTKLSQLGANIDIRIPLIEGVNTDDIAINDIISFLKNNINFNLVNLLPYHNTGSGKYSRLGMVYKGVDLKTPTDSRLNEIIAMFNKSGINNVKVGG